MRFIHYTDADNLDSILSRGIMPFNTVSSYKWAGEEPQQKEDYKIERDLKGYQRDSGVWNTPVVFADILFEDEKARYNGWLNVLWSEDQNLSDSEKTVGIVFQLNHEDKIYIGQWGHPIMLPEKDTRTIFTTWDDYANGQLYAQQVKTTIVEFEDTLNASVQSLNNLFIEHINEYDFVLNDWMDYEDIRETVKIGKVLHFFKKLRVAGLALEKELNLGDKICFLGVTTNFEMIVNSMHKEHNNISSANRGDEVGIKVPSRVRRNDLVHKINKEWKNPKNEKNVKSICYPWPGCGFEVCIPYLVPHNQILGYHLFGSKDQLNDAWYKEEMF
jgi:hypothetical protein